MTRKEMVAAAVAGAAFAAFLGVFWLQSVPPELPDHPPAAAAVAPPAEPLDLPMPPAAEPSSESPVLSVAARQRIDRKVQALAAEMSRMWTRNPDELVAVIENASRNESVSPPVTLLLAIAHAETNGKILDVSEAGAVGLAQATPVAYLQEELPGRLFITDDYVLASRAYIMKKPLGDADKVLSVALKARDGKGWNKAKGLLDSAKELRREGVNELELLEPFAPEGYSESIEKMDAHNKAVLDDLGKILKRRDVRAMKSMQTRVRREYAVLRTAQARGWKQYQNDLISARDRMIAEHFGDAESAKKMRPYEVAEYLGEHLDARFSAEDMARFLVRHLERKKIEAETLAPAERTVEEMTAALYNGGSHNVKRLLAGLISSLPETQKYMKKVPATRKRLDAIIAQAELEPAIQTTDATGPLAAR